MIIAKISLFSKFTFKILTFVKFHSGAMEIPPPTIASILKKLEVFSCVFKEKGSLFGTEKQIRACASLGNVIGRGIDDQGIDRMCSLRRARQHVILVVLSTRAFTEPPHSLVLISMFSFVVLKKKAFFGEQN